MLSSLTPPTDNLYKFVAIFGLIIAITAVTVPAYPIFEYANRWLTLRHEFELFALDAAKVERMAAGLERDATTVEQEAAVIDGETTANRVDVVSESGAESGSPGIESPDLGHKINALARNMNELTHDTEELTRKSENFVYKAEQLRLYEFVVYVLCGLSFLGVTVGVFMMIGGFRKWYTKVQVYEDLVLAQTCNAVTASEAADGTAALGPRLPASPSPTATPSSRPKTSRKSRRSSD